MQKLNFDVQGLKIQFALQDLKERAEERGELFERITFTPAITNGEEYKFNLGFGYQIRRAGLHAGIEEVFNPTFNPLVFPYHWTDERRQIGEWGWIAAELLVGDGPTANIIVPTKDSSVSMRIAKPYTRHPVTQVKIIETTGDFVKLVKVTPTLFQGQNDNTVDEYSNLPNASLLYSYRRALAQGAVIEVYPVVETRRNKEGGTWFDTRLQLKAQQLYQWLSLIDKGELDLDTAARQHYTQKALVAQTVRDYQKGVATGEITEEVIREVTDNARRFVTGEAVVERDLTVNVDGEIIDVALIPSAIFTGLVNGRTQVYDTRKKMGRMNLDAATRKFNGSLKLVRQPENFSF
jgi:hypothetical protein